MKMITKKDQIEIDAKDLRKLKFLARIIYDRFGSAHESGAKDQTVILDRIAEDVYYANDVIL